jgi:hypothetical protein
MTVCQAEMVAVTPTLPRTARPTKVPTWYVSAETQPSRYSVGREARIAPGPYCG